MVNPNHHKDKQLDINPYYPDEEDIQLEETPPNEPELDLLMPIEQQLELLANYQAIGHVLQSVEEEDEGQVDGGEEEQEEEEEEGVADEEDERTEGKDGEEGDDECEEEEQEEEEEEEKVQEDDEERVPFIDYDTLFANLPLPALPDWTVDEQERQKLKKEQLPQGSLEDDPTESEGEDEDEQDPEAITRQFNELFLLPPPPPQLPPEEIERFFANLPLPTLPQWILAEAAEQLAQIAAQDARGNEQPIHAAQEVIVRAAEQAALYYSHVARREVARQREQREPMQPIVPPVPGFDEPQSSQQPPQVREQLRRSTSQQTIQTASRNAAASLGAGDAPINEEEFFANLPLPPLPLHIHVPVVEEESLEEESSDEPLPEEPEEPTAEEMMLEAVQRAAEYITKHIGPSAAQKIAQSVLRKVTQFDPQSGQSTSGSVPQSPRESIDLIIKQTRNLKHAKEPVPEQELGPSDDIFAGSPSLPQWILNPGTEQIPKIAALGPKEFEEATRDAQDALQETEQEADEEFSDTGVSIVTMEQLSELIATASSDELAEIFARLPLPPIPSHRAAPSTVEESEPQVDEPSGDELDRIFADLPIPELPLQAPAAEDIAEMAEEYEEAANIARSMLEQTVEQAIECVKQAVGLPEQIEDGKNKPDEDREK